MKMNKKLGVIFVFVFMVLLMGYFSYDITSKMLSNSFGGITGNLTIKYDVTYSSNYPDDLMEDSTRVYNEKSDYIILDNMFDEINGYEFVGWNTLANGSGTMYLVNDSIYLTKNITLYAQWEKVLVSVVSYGDVDKNDVIDDEDYKLLDNYILGGVTLDEDALVNADVNVDGNIDLVDVDIIKQAVLGIDGYVGILPDNPILKYEVYVDNSGNDEDAPDNEESGESDNGEVVVPGGNTSVGTGGNGTGNTGSGTGSTGSGNNTGSLNKPGGNISSNEGNSENNTSNNNNSSNTEDIEEDKEIVTNYEFKYMIGDLIYSITECEDVVDGSCNLILPKSVPVREGYNFLGWSIDKSCNVDTFINSSISVNKSGIYYACFVLKEEIDNKSYIGIMVFVIWIMTGILIYKVVCKYRDEKRNNE